MIVDLHPAWEREFTAATERYLASDDEALFDDVARAQNRIMETPANTLEGIGAQLRWLSHYIRNGNLAEDQHADMLDRAASTLGGFQVF